MLVIPNGKVKLLLFFYEKFVLGFSQVKRVAPLLSSAAKDSRYGAALFFI